MSDQQQPLSVWQQCKAIAYALAPAPMDIEQVRQNMRAALLEQLVTGSDQGAKLAARLANTDGPIEVEPGDLPPEFSKLLPK